VLLVSYLTEVRLQNVINRWTAPLLKRKPATTPKV